MKKVTKMPIGLGMNHLEQEISACHLWNHHVDKETNPEEWVSKSEYGNPGNLFTKNDETGLSLENSGFLEVNNDKFRLTSKAIELIDKFVNS